MSSKKGLNAGAYTPQTPDKPYEPYVASGELRAEFSIKAVSLGIVFGIVFGAANAYLGLVAGLTISTSIPIAVMTVAAFRILQGLGRRGDILEANISQTVGSASSSLASGIIFTLRRDDRRAFHDTSEEIPYRQRARQAPLSRGNGLRRGPGGQ
jgi:hypothetical protein